ncbi:glycosyltransferase family 4 protein [Hymenobacter sp. HDW8]|uniref:glycosyltransferase family 4 protein n=1 Tax=Hymenobacter sp. HDW8 TaxID=2714932 RepID=UPI00140B3378|nr:glycosyltransferase family 4 protein [Hymenobacter sp. HDW8]QIL77334.1 glycosyltransferase family 4 protein [Hymenobacter sp. HDW8]
MATVIRDMLANTASGVEFIHFVSHGEGSASEKISSASRAFLKLLQESDIDVVHIHVASDASFYRKSLFVLQCRVRRIPVVMHVHGADFDTFYNQSGALQKAYIRKIFSQCSKILVLSSFWQTFFRQNITPDNVEVLHNGVYPAAFASCFTTPDNLNRFLFLGRLGQRKGVYDLLKAVEDLKNKHPQTNLRFYLAGDGEIEQVQQLIEAKGLIEQVKVLGWMGDEEKRHWLQQADTMVLPSYNEGLPMSILEAMAGGKIIISSRVGGIPDLVTEGVNGFLITPGDVESLSKHITYVATHPAEMLQMARSNQQKIEADYNLEKLNAWLVAMYHDISQVPTP